MLKLLKIYREIRNKKPLRSHSRIPQAIIGGNYSATPGRFLIAITAKIPSGNACEIPERMLGEILEEDPEGIPARFHGDIQEEFLQESLMKSLKESLKKLMEESLDNL